MKQLRYIILFLLTIFIFSGCAGRPQVTVVRPDGGPSPNPYYVLRTTGQQHPIQLSFYYAAVDHVEDLDGSKQPAILYLERRKEYSFSKVKYPDLHAVLRILNPRNKAYKVHYRMKANFSNGGQMDIYSEIAHSDMKYREITCPLPLVEGMSEVQYELEITDEVGKVLIRTGRFQYKFI